MKIVVQRVLRAHVTINKKIVGKINNGFVILIGISINDTCEDVIKMAKKIAHLRVFEDKNGKMNNDIISANGSILSISQFTLCADSSHGNRPSFINAANKEHAQPLYELLNKTLINDYHIPLETGIFGEQMIINIENDGPVTVILES